jgi:hypothetical protein
MERGFTTAWPGLIGGAGLEQREARLVFAVPGTPTSLNPLKALRQGLADEPSTRVYRINGERCSACGFLELYANDPMSES